MNKRMMNHSIKPTVFVSLIALLLHFLPGKTAASPPSKNEKNKWFISGSIGTAVLSREISKDFQMLENEFQHNPGLAFDVSLGKTLGRRLEPALRFSVFNLSGDSDLPDFSAIGIHPGFSGPIYQMPVEYVTVSGALSGILRFYFREIPGKNENTFRIDPFVEAGGGANMFASEVRYKTVPPGESSSVIFQKGTNSQTAPITVGQAVLGVGTKIGNPGKWQLEVAYNINMVNYACLDAVHNYTNGKRSHAKGIASRFKVGIVIPLGGVTSIATPKKDDHLPWAP